MKIKEFKLERYFGIHEFTAKNLLSSSDCDGYDLEFVLDKASTSELELWNEMTLGYTESQGHPILREAVLQYYAIKNIEHVVIGSPGELNFITMNLLLEANDHVIAMAPSYQSLYEIAKSLKCELSYWQPDPDNWKFNTEDLKKLIKNNTKLLIINFPHNPTGSYLTLSELTEITRFARSHNLHVFSDEMYHKLTVGEYDELPPISDLYERGISLWGTSKTLGLAGLRIGWLVSEDIDFINNVLAFKDYLSICSSAPSEILSLIALNHLDDFLLPNMNKIRKNINLFDGFAAQNEIIASFIPPQAGSTSFVKLNIDHSSLQFSNTLVEKMGIMTIPAEMFDYPGKLIRVGFGRKNFEETLRRFKIFLDYQF